VLRLHGEFEQLWRTRLHARTLEEWVTETS